MLSQKRKLAEDSDDGIDISSALLREKGGEESDDDLNRMIQSSIAKRDIKGGTEVLKKAKGKGKMVKGEVGGGSFQSMGMSFNLGSRNARHSIMNRQPFTRHY